MFQATIHFPTDKVSVEFEGEFAYTKWLGYLKEHGMATAKLVGSERSVMVFRTNISYIEAQSDGGPAGTS